MKLLKTQSFEIAVNNTGDERASRIAILLPGRLDTKDYINFVSHAEILAKKGFFVVAIDPPGTWDSPGDINDYSTSMYIKAVIELIDYFGNRPTLLLGHSRGGAVAMLASFNPSVVGVVLINAAYGYPSPPDPKLIENNALPEYRDIPPGNVRTVEKRRFDLPLAYFEDGTKHDPASALANYRGAKLLVHATRDEFTPLDEVKEIFSNLSEPKMFLEIDCYHDYRLYPNEIESVNNSLEHFVDKFMPVYF